ncbi:unnamed protein product [Adineta ricciae]|uniref:Uncharacterized protein n=1 Tax=Adineta ricciae TaxID=249248 RepID=A0A813SMI9_ADIRI|nr:unnamed protein product [Adineta ricciae]
MDDEDNKLNLIPGPILLILGSVYTLIVLCILLIIPILQLAFGGSYLGQCPVEPNIPVYLIVTGACGLASILLTIMIVLSFILVLKRQTAATAVTAACIIGCVLIFLFVMSLFLFAWFIAGNVWIFGVHKKVDLDNSSSPNYCQRTLYQFAFAMLIISYVMCGISCCCSCFRSCLQAKSAFEQES